MKTIKVKGKDYVPVNERVKYFLQNCPGYHIETEFVKIDADSCIMVANIFDENGNIKATGHAEEQRSASMINKTSFVENCETSAVGRALGFLGIGIDDSIATADEVADAISKQETLKEKVGKNHLAALKLLCEEKGSDITKVLDYFGATEETLTVDQWSQAMSMLNRKA